MYKSLPSFVFGFHGCDKEVAMKILNGKEHLNPSKNKYDWLGIGIYFWEHDPHIALNYATGIKSGTQFANTKIKTPFVLGAVIDLQNCLNIPSTQGIIALREGFNDFEKVTMKSGIPIPKNDGANRRLDWAVMEYIHGSNEKQNHSSYDSVRAAFPEGETVYPGANITEKNHIQLCVRNINCIKGYFLPQPSEKYNPYL